MSHTILTWIAVRVVETLRKWAVLKLTCTILDSQDLLLAELLASHRKWIVNYHEHDSLLENKISEDLTEEERKAAWEEFENEKKGILNHAAAGKGHQRDGRECWD